MTRPRNPVQLGVIGAPHGIRGEVRVKSFTEDPTALGSYGPLYTADGRALEVEAVRPANNVVIVRFAGVSDRSAAEALNGEALFVERFALPTELEEEEFYHADLVGLTVLDETGDRVGKIVAVHNFGAGDLLEIRPSTGPTIMIPFTRASVPEIDLEAGTACIDSVAAGLHEDEQARSSAGEEAEPNSEPSGPKAAGGNH